MIVVDEVARRMRSGTILLMFGFALVGVQASAAGLDSDAAAMAYENGDYAEAFRTWSALAEKGDVLAQYNLGLMHFKGAGVPRHYGLAVKWFAVASGKGVAPAAVNLAAMFEEGRGVPKDIERAFVLLTVGVNSLGPGDCHDIAENKRRKLAVLLEPDKVADAVRRAKLLGASPIRVHQRDCFETVAMSTPRIVEPKTRPVEPKNIPVVKIPKQDSGESATAQTGEMRRPVEAAKDAIGGPGFYVQVASLASDELAQVALMRVKRQHGGLLGDHPIGVRRAELADHGAVFRLRIGPLSDEHAAKELCSELQQNSQDCFVVRQKEKPALEP